MALQVKEKCPREYQERLEEWRREIEALRHTLTKWVRIGNEHANINVSPLSFYFQYILTSCQLSLSFLFLLSSSLVGRTPISGLFTFVRTTRTSRLPASSPPMKNKPRRSQRGKVLGPTRHRRRPRSR